MRDHSFYQRINFLRLRPDRNKRLVFTLAAILVGLLPLALTETVLRYCHIGYVSDADDPYVGFVNVRPLFKLNQETDRYEIAPERQVFFQPDSFSAQKRSNEFRIFCLGGSTVQGRPYSIETSFSTWLEINLQTADPQRHWEVVNCGGVSYASYRLVPIVREVLNYQPDLLIICSGHNEFLEDRTYGPIKQAPRWLTQTHVWLSRLHTYNALRSLAIRWRGDSRNKGPDLRPQLPEEVDALLDYRGGLDDYHRDEHWHQGVISHFNHNLHTMVTRARERGVSVILVSPPYNLKDTPPFKYENGAGLTDQQQLRFAQLWEDAKQEGLTVLDRIALLQQAIAIDSQHAAVHFHLGRCYLGRQEYDAAKTQLIMAKDEDICPLRILSPMRQAIAEVAHDHATPLIDAQDLFEQLTADHITGNEWFVDHVHPSMRGHQRLAIALFDEMARQAWVHATPGYEKRRDAAFLKHLQSLDAMYYIRGQQRLTGLQRWAQGRAARIKASSQTSPPAAADTPQKGDPTRE